ncbi:hypothetical protein ACIGCM_14985 [Pseudomonas sp. NPDC078700]|uniref:hypothetical protein n=1 Tax=Pseudomonas sp. NPDC078700 TaxID=3364424 RepID=UPI0037C7BC97
MVMHYETTDGQLACGRDAENLDSTSKPKKVTCKTCLGSHVMQDIPGVAKLQKKAKKQAKKQPKKKSTPSETYDWKHEWAAMCHSVRPYDRLPRGFESYQI